MRDWLVAHANNLPSGNPLPTEMEVAAHFGASRQTANKVLSEMARDGLVKRIKGLGTFVQSREGAVLDGDTGALCLEKFQPPGEPRRKIKERDPIARIAL